MADLIPDDERAKAEADRRFPESDTHTDEEAAFQSTARYSFQEGAAWQRARPVSPVTREDVRELVEVSDEYFDAMQGGERENWTRLIAHLWKVTEALKSLSVSPSAEVKWEYGLRKPLDAVPRMTGSESLMIRMQKIHGGEIFKRTAPGEWVPVKGTEQ
jgi:hypothetical protein